MTERRAIHRLLAVGILGFSACLLSANLEGPERLLAVTSTEPPPLYLRAEGSSNVLAPVAPTGLIPQFEDAPSLNRSTFKPIATWAAAPITSTASLAALSQLHVWLGLVSSDDQGTNFDLRAELTKNGVVIADGETTNITGVTRNPRRAKEVIVAFGPISGPYFAAGDLLA